MLSCRLTIKIKDYFPKVTSIPYINYICLFTCGEYQGQIPFLPDETKFLQHQLKNISTDIKYKVLILDFNDMTLIGMCEMNIAYKVLSRILPQNGFIQEQQKKLIIDTKTKRKLFGTVINSGDIYLNIYTEVFLISKNFNDQKIKNSKLKKNHPMINTPKCYIKYNFALNKSDFSPKSSKNNKSTMVNSNSEKQTLNLSKQEKDKENKINKYNNNNSINYKKEAEKKNLGNYSNYNIINNNINFFNKKSEVDIYNNKKNIMDLLQQKKMMEEIVENYNKSDMDEKIDIIGEDEYINDNNLYIKAKEGFMTDQNFNQKYIINNKDNEMRQGKQTYKLNNNIINDDYINNIEDEDDNQKKLYYYSKNSLNLKGNKNLFIDEEGDYNMSKTLKNKNFINPNMNLINPNYVYSSKNKIIKMGKIYNKSRINDKMKKIININNSNINRKSDEDIYQNYFTNTNINNNQNNINNYYNNFTQSEININNYTTNENNNFNNKNGASSKYSEEEGDDDFLDIDHIILEKGAELRNDFHSQLKRYQDKYNNHKTVNSLNNKIYSENNYYFNHNSNTPFLEKTLKYSNTNNLNNYLTQEDIKNNCIKLIEFYSLLNLKLKKIYPKNSEITQKLLIFKELLSSELRKKNIITNRTNKNNFIYDLSTNINETTNEKILNAFPKIKKLENSIYQQLFNVFNTQEELSKYSEFENYDKQTKIFLLLNLARNLVKKYGSISQIYTIKSTVNMKKKKKLKKCLQNYLITEKEPGDKDFVNLETINIINKNNQKDVFNDDHNKFKVIKEVDEDKEEENENEEKEENGEYNDKDGIKEIEDENWDQIIEDVDIIEENNNDNNNNCVNNDKSQSDFHLKENGEVNNNDINNLKNNDKEKNELDNYINIEENNNPNNNSEDQIDQNNNIDDKNENINIQDDLMRNEENQKNEQNKD